MSGEADSLNKYFSLITYFGSSSVSVNKSNGKKELKTPL